MDFYDKLRKMLKNVARSVGIKKSEMKKYFVPENDIRGLEDEDEIKKRMFERVAFTLQNKGRNSNVINYMGKKKEIADFCFNYDVNKFYDEYNKGKGILDEAKIINSFNKIYGNQENQPTRTAYCKGLFQFVQFTNDKDNFNELCAYVNGTGRKSNGELDLSEVYEVKKIHGLGIALACDFLKEIGCTWLCKPDGHIINFFEDGKVDKKLRHLLKVANLDADYVFVCKNPNKKSQKGLSKEDIIILWFDLFVQELNARRKKNNIITAYQLDRAIWLFSTLNFYQDGGLLTNYTKQQMISNI